MNIERISNEFKATNIHRILLFKEQQTPNTVLTKQLSMSLE